MTFIFQVKMYFKCIYWLLIFVINILIKSTWKWHWRPCSCEVEEMAWNFGTPWTKSSCFNRTYRFFGPIRYASPVPHLVNVSLFRYPNGYLIAKSSTLYQQNDQWKCGQCGWLISRCGEKIYSEVCMVPHCREFWVLWHTVSAYV